MDWVFSRILSFESLLFDGSIWISLNYMTILINLNFSVWISWTFVRMVYTVFINITILSFSMHFSSFFLHNSRFIFMFSLMIFCVKIFNLLLQKNLLQIFSLFHLCTFLFAPKYEWNNKTIKSSCNQKINQEKPCNPHYQAIQS